MGVINLTFYSGKLWHSDKPVPIKICNGEIDWISPIHDDDGVYWGTCKACRTYDGYSKQTRCTVDLSRGVDIWDEMMEDWLSTAYEVVNPEVIPPIYHNPIDDSLKDGDQFTLPDGYGIETAARHKWKEGTGMEFVRLVATITLPGKPDNSAHGSPKYYCGDCNVSIGGISSVCNYPECGGEPEPSESQEETQEAMLYEILENYDDWRMDGDGDDQYNESLKQFMKAELGKFTITRK